MTNVIGKNLYIQTNAFQNNQTIVNIDLCNVPFTKNSMVNSFKDCFNLNRVSNINQNVTNMYQTFMTCNNLENAPAIPNSVTRMYRTFYSCKNMVRAPIIPNGVTDINGVFLLCNSLKNAPDIPNTVTNMDMAFYICPSLINAPVIPNSISRLYLTFGYCSNLVNAPVIPNSVTNMYSTFNSCYSLVNPPVIPNSVTTMYSTFNCCYSLVNAPNIPDSVTTMIYTFNGCNSLVDAPTLSNNAIDIGGIFGWCNKLVNAPVIPNSVTSMASTFFRCYSLVDSPIIPSNVTSIAQTYRFCNNLTNIPTIPSSVTNMYMTFDSCSNINGNIYIRSENITNAYKCFNNTSLRKNVFIPFTYENNVNTLTYNTFIIEGYDTLGSKNNVYLMDIYTSVTINPTPADASVSMYSHMKGSGVDLSNWTYTNDSYNNYELQTYTGSSNDVVLPTKYTNTKSLKTDEGDVVEYIVSKQGYKTITGSVEVDESKIIDVVLDGMVTYTIYPIPYDATVVLTASGYTQEGNSITVPTGTEVSYTVSRQCHITQSGTLQSDTDISRYITLPYEYYTFTINCNEEDADIEILVNGKLVNATNNNWIIGANNYNNDIELQEYIGSDANVVMPTNYNVNNSVSVTYKDVITYSVSKPEFNRVTGTEMLTADKTIYVEITDEHELDIVDYEYTNVNRHLELNKYIGSNSDVVIPNAEW